MPSYRRSFEPGRTFFLTVSTRDAIPWLARPVARAALRAAIARVRVRRPFVIDAWVALPEHIHCVWTLPQGDHDCATRWRLIKRDVSMRVGRAGFCQLAPLWRPRFLYHPIRDLDELAVHCDYVHYDPVKHGLCGSPEDWPHSSLHGQIRVGLYPPGWRSAEPAPPMYLAPRRRSG